MRITDTDRRPPSKTDPALEELLLFDLWTCPRADQRTHCGRTTPSWLVALVVLGAALGAHLSADAGHAEALVPNGAELQVNSYTSGGQSYPSVAGHDDGFVVAWDSFGSPGDDSNQQSVQARRLDADGHPLGEQFQVNVETPAFQRTPSVAAWPDGRFVIVWNSTNLGSLFSGLVGRVFAANGTAATDPFSIALGTSAIQPADVAIAADGASFVVVWPDTTYPPDIAGRRYLADGTADGAQFQIGSPQVMASEERPRIAAAPGGGFRVAWTDGASSGSDIDGKSIQMRQLDADGDPIGSQLQVNSYTTGDQRFPDLAFAADGSFVVVWDSEGGGPAGDSAGMVGRLFDSNGDPLGDDFQVNSATSGTQEEGSVGFLPDGDFIVTWTDGDGSASNVRMRRFDAAGTALGGELVVNTLQSGFEHRSEIATTADGEALVAWQSDISSGDDDSETSIQAVRLVAPVFQDGFESGDTLAWSSSLP